MKCQVYKIQVDFLFKFNFLVYPNPIEQWKRIAARMGQTSPPLSRQYCLKATCIFEPPNGHIPEVLGSYRRPGRTENEQDQPPVVPNLIHTLRRKILFGSSVLAIIIAIIVAVAVAVVLGLIYRIEKRLY